MEARRGRLLAGKYMVFTPLFQDAFSVRGTASRLGLKQRRLFFFLAAGKYMEYHIIQTQCRANIGSVF